MKEYLTVGQVAEQLDITKYWIRGLIQAKEIKLTKIGKWRVRRRRFEGFRKRDVYSIATEHQKIIILNRER